MKSSCGRARSWVPLALVVLWACGANEEPGSRGARPSDEAASAATDRQEAQARRASPDFSVAGLSVSEVESFLDSLKAAVANDDRRAVASLVSYPIRVQLDGQDTMIASADDFVARYPDIVNDNVKSAVLAQEAAELFVNWQGVMIGRGEVWFSAVYEDPRDDETYHLRIIAINNQGDV